jgi:predicted  nucleic acid-binding Zn-ribbon protein
MILPEIEKLLILQDRDRKLRALRVEHKNAPLEKQAFADKQTAAQAQLDAARQKAKEFEVERKKLETEVTGIRDKIAKYQVQKFQTRKNEEFAALNHEIERAEKDIQLIEDRELDIMDASDKQKPIIAEAEKNFSAAKGISERQAADLDAKVKALGEQIAAVEAERAKLAAEVDEELLDTYDRLLRTKNGEAVVGLRHDVCSGCHMKVTPTTSSIARAAKTMVQCENCARIVYWED